MKDFFQKVQSQLDAKLPFVIYRKPNSERVEGLLQKDNSVFQTEEFTEKGFVMASFDGREKVLIPENQSEKITSNHIKQTETDFVLPEKTFTLHAKNDFENLVQKGIDAINNKDFNKVVLSRTEILELLEFDTIFIFEKLINNYPSAFCYCFFHPKIGLWFGATPEKLLQVKNNKFQTMALAGTQQFNDIDEVIWENKEKEEQQFVTDFILENLESVTSDIAISNPYTYRAGNLLHIKTDIEGAMDKDSTIKKILDILHPTPAVCGLPKLAAKEFILANEGYSRSFYSGFLGELNSDGLTDLYVNLRCMEIKNQRAHLYMGCGITKDSIPEKEFEETVNKSMTMKKILKDI
ncbi:hypothetical protein FNO01nite_30070 [Flavobacterium noncentrifugens]|uniref:isochorismate synthase n=1 Tax=Flavobacterium noncentrifugens TaxID=1128970 RepID=A0A1G9BQI9_9FLAO|nr:chorismate-binding protein [Flavobacterium noncentrifugens]GEP52335.1 hypothetical protein FNO01nite_30070 [Flavobacterium noncentrifugens]SDK41771.1 isochorismate synthase [Flavobacterium noncentrifugens]